MVNTDRGLLKFGAERRKFTLYLTNPCKNNPEENPPKINAEEGKKILVLEVSIYPSC